MSGRQTVRQAFDGINSHDSKAVASLYAENTVVHDPQYPEPLRGREAVQRDLDDFLGTFPDLHGEVRSTIEDGDRVSYEFQMTGTHRGPLPTPTGDIPPTGKRIEMRGAGFIEFNRDGQIMEEHRYYDVASLLGQIGGLGIPGTEPPIPRT